ncbi:MAG TPA: ATP-binding protein [Bryobacteraceae bacterium]|jgi:two-component system NtrC family sensor kinase|nr:ATP-binding protein [Bryobacteraceae bacterium]
MSPAAAELHQMASIGRLLAGIVHEINTPLGSIFSDNEVLCRSLGMLIPLMEGGSADDVAKARRIVETMQQLVSVDKIACDRIRSVIRGLKTIARTDSPEPLKIDLNQLLRDTLKLTQVEFRKRIAVQTEFGDLPEVECFPQMLGQVFLNLLVNAAQAIDGNGTITVRTSLEDADAIAHVSITDTGQGMKPEQQAKAFQAGFTTKAVGEGTGLGLSIAREIVEEKHRGSIKFESQPGVGTVFHVRIPVSMTRSQV